MTAVSDATAALAHRLRLAAQHGWGGDVCDAEADAYVATLQAGGWRHHEVPPVRSTAPANPAVAALRAREARQAIRDAAGNGPETGLGATENASHVQHGPHDGRTT